MTNYKKLNKQFSEEKTHRCRFQKRKRDLSHSIRMPSTYKIRICEVLNYRPDCYHFSIFKLKTFHLILWSLSSSDLAYRISANFACISILILDTKAQGNIFISNLSAVQQNMAVKLN